MKVRLLITFLLVVFLANSQTYSFTDIRLAAFIDSLKYRAQIDVAYDVKALPVDSVIFVHYIGLSPEQILVNILDSQFVDVLRFENQIIIRKKKVSELKSSVICLRGTISSASDNSPLPLVNVCVKGSSLGTVTNDEGQFQFVVPRRLSPDTLVVSSIGYSNFYIPMPLRDTTLNVVLDETSIALNEVVVKFDNPVRIVDKTLANQPQNYHQTKQLLTGFFRETINQDGKYLTVSEAVIQIIKGAYDSSPSLERVKFVKGRKFVQKQNELVQLKLEGGPFYFSRIDVARYLDFLPSKTGENAYVYYNVGFESYNGELLYKIGFKPLVDSGELMYQGELLIHTHSYALVRANFELTKKSIRYSRKTFIQHESASLKAVPLSAKYTVDYRLINNKWILNKVRGELELRVQDKLKQLNSVFVAVSELLITDANSLVFDTFPNSETYKSNYILADEIEETDEVFWQNYNIIKPDSQLESVFK